jgi:hypothetical protein
MKKFITMVLSVLLFSCSNYSGDVLDDCNSVLDKCMKLLGPEMKEKCYSTYDTCVTSSFGCNDKK